MIVRTILRDWVWNEIPKNIAEISLTFTSDKDIRELNLQYRRKDKATDVLSFPLLSKGESSAGLVSLGDIVISLETAKKQAVKYGCSLKEEITRLLVHGILHLLGYDHENVSSREAQRMRRKEKIIIENII